MKRSLLIAGLLVVLLAAGCRDNSADLRHQAQVEALMQQLSIREKVAQLIVGAQRFDPCPAGFTHPG